MLTKKQWDDPAFREKVSFTMKKTNERIWANTAFREMQSTIAKDRFTKLWGDPDYKEQVSSKIAASWDKVRRAAQAKNMSAMVTRNNSLEVTCPHCGKLGKGIAIMKRWHFDNCRSKLDAS
jgi:hypothetical protein